MTKPAMIEAALLRSLGWSDELIEAVTHAAEPLRHTPTASIVVPVTKVQSLSCTAMYSDAVIANTSREISTRSSD